MKNRISLFIVILMMVHLHTAFALRTNGRDCSGTFPTSFFSSKNKHIIEKFEWKNTHTLYPYIGSVGYEEATIEGRIEAYQKVEGHGSVGVSVEGSVSGPDFSLTLDKEFATDFVGLPYNNRLDNYTTNSGANDEPGSYTLTGNAEYVAVGLGGGITVLGTGFTLTEPIRFETTGDAEPVTLTLSVKKEYPKTYECAHENCEVGLPDKHHHRVDSCPEDAWNPHTERRHTCRRQYYLCQTSTCPLESWHAVDYACGHTDRKQNASAHELQASCTYSTIQNGQTVNCTISNFYKCKPHSVHLLPSDTSSTSSTPDPMPEPPVSPSTPTDNTPDCSNCTDGCSSCQATCANSHIYDPRKANQVNEHRTRTCRFCGQTWEVCGTGRPDTCNDSKRKKNGQGCWALD